MKSKDRQNPIQTAQPAQTKLKNSVLVGLVGELGLVRDINCKKKFNSVQLDILGLKNTDPNRIKPNLLI